MGPIKEEETVDPVDIATLDIPLLIRDMIWGIGWITIITIIYAVLYNKNK